MEILSIDTHLSCYILFVSLIAVLAVIFRYYREHDAVFWDASTYFLVLMCLYIALPAYIHTLNPVTLIGASYETIMFSGKYSLYFISIVTIYYLIKTVFPLLKKRRTTHGFCISIALVPISNGAIYLIYAVITTYILSAFFLNSPGIFNLWTDRAMAAHFKMTFNATYKTQLMFAITISMAVYLTIKNGVNKYIAMFIPFITMDLMTTDRSFLFEAFMASIGILLLTKTKIPVIKLAFISFIIVSMEVIRSSWQENILLSQLQFIPGELLFTTESSYIMIESKLSTNIFEYSLYSLGKIFTPKVMDVLFESTPHFANIINAESTLLTGLGGSLLSEVFSAKSLILYILYPFVAISYLEIINFIKYYAGYFGILVFVFYLFSTHAIFRNGIIFTSVEPIYYTVYAASWYWFAKIFFADRLKHSQPLFMNCPCPRM